MAFSLIIPVDEIPDPGLAIKGELPAEWLAASLLEAYAPKGPVTVDLLAKRYNDNIYVEGRLSADVTFQCSRTLKPGSKHFKLKVSELFQPASAIHINLSEGVDADDIDDELRTYSDKTIDFEPTLRELIVLAQDPYPRVDGDAADSDSEQTSVAWKSEPEQVHPRWAALQNIKLN